METDDWFNGLDIPDLKTKEELQYEYRRYTQRKIDQGVERELEKEERERRLVTASCLDNVWDVSTHWLWRDRIPMADFTIVGGRASIGKSLFLNTLASWITVGDCRGEFEGTPANVLYIANEDSYERTVVPRMRAAGADLKRVFRVDVSFEGEPAALTFPRDLERLTEIVRDLDVVTVIVDPISSNMSDRDRNSPQVRQSYERLRRWAEETGVAVIGNGHLKKGQFSDFLEGFMGSSEIGNVARAAIGIALDTDTDDRSVIVSQCKNNNGPMDLKSYTYRVESRDYMRPTGTIGTAPVLVWGESTDKHVNDIFSDPTPADVKSDVQECREWLEDYLRVNPGTERYKVFADGRKESFKEHTIKRAAKFVAESRSIPNSFPRRVAWYSKGDAKKMGQSGQLEQSTVGTVPTASGTDFP